MTKQQLKNIVKECLIEILEEGLGGGNTSLSSLPDFEPEKSENSRLITRSDIRGESRIPQPRQVQKNSKLDEPAFKTNVKRVAKALAGTNSVMQSIFEDTAKTSLQEMLNSSESPHMGAAPAAAQVMNKHAPEDIFDSKEISKWNDLVFGNNVPKDVPQQTQKHQPTQQRATRRADFSHLFNDNDDIKIPSAM